MALGRGAPPYIVRVCRNGELRFDFIDAGLDPTTGISRHLRRCFVFL